MKKRRKPAGAGKVPTRKGDKPIEPHHRTAKRGWINCENCNGRGLVPNETEGFHSCPVCGGTGGRDGTYEVEDNETGDR